MDICALHCLEQHVSSPTSGDNLLDLVIPDIPGKSTTSVVPPIGRSDHAVVITDFHALNCTSRMVWRCNLASWPRLRAYFRQTDWTALFAPGRDSESVCQAITNHIQQGMEQFIPSKNLTTRPSDPRWWTPECSTAVLAKDRAWKNWRQDARNYTLKTTFLDSVTAASQTLS